MITRNRLRTDRLIRERFELREPRHRSACQRGCGQGLSGEVHVLGPVAVLVRLVNGYREDMDVLVDGLQPEETQDVVPLRVWRHDLQAVESPRHCLREKPLPHRSRSLSSGRESRSDDRGHCPA